MGLTFICPHCGQKLNIALEDVDETFPCPLCKRRVGDPPEAPAVKNNELPPVISRLQIAASNRKFVTTLGVALGIFCLVAAVLVTGIVVLIFALP